MNSLITAVSLDDASLLQLKRPHTQAPRKERNKKEKAAAKISNVKATD